MSATVVALLFAGGLAVGGAFSGSGGGSTTTASAASVTSRLVAAPSALPPLPVPAFDGPFAAYRRYVSGQLSRLAGEVGALRSAVARNDRAGAQRQWLRAYATYGRVGAAYGAFGALDAAIDGTAAGLPGGAHDPHFSGLHRVEDGLWGGSVPATRPWVSRLAGDVARLRGDVGTLELDPLEYATRAHEILEMAKPAQLGGVAVPASRAGVVGLAAAADATREVLGTLSVVLADRAGAGQPASATVQALRRELAAVAAAHGGRLPPLTALTRTEHDRLVARTDTALEALAKVPEALETRPNRPVVAMGHEAGA